MQFKHFVKVFGLCISKLQLCVSVVSRLDAQSLHTLERFQSFLWLVLLCACLHVEAEIALCVLSLIEERLEVGIKRLQNFVRWNKRLA